MSTTAQIPYNLQRQDASTVALENAVDYAVQISTGYAGWLAYMAQEQPSFRARSFAGADVLDLGPGPTLGAALLLASCGANVSVADKYLVSWDDGFHPAFVNRLLDRMRDRDAAYQEPLRRVLAANAFDASLTRIAASAEGLHDVGKRWDIILSNAVLEHVIDMAAAAKAMYASTKPGGIGFHQIDLRDHRNFDHPLRYLTEDQRTFDSIPGGETGDYGSRRRLSDYVRCFADAGFRIVCVNAHLQAENEYVARLRPALAADMRDRTDADIMSLGALLCVERSEG
jgi:SAM-dependent methyltransferase